MIRVRIFDKKIVKRACVPISILFSILGALFTFVDFLQLYRFIAFVVAIILSVIIYIVIFHKVKNMKKLSLQINNSTLTILFGDIFKQKEIKIIPFNEYFDTIVDEEIISKNTLNGKYIKTLDSTETLDNEICSSEHLEENLVEINELRKRGKRKKYRLGTIHKRLKYFLLAFSKFDNNNSAYLTMNEYVLCLLNMWNQVDILYQGEAVTIPLLGSGITRMKDNVEITDQELLEIIIWTFRISKVKFAYPSQVRIVINENKFDKINLFKIEGDSHGI